MWITYLELLQVQQNEKKCKQLRRKILIRAYFQRRIDGYSQLCIQIYSWI